MLISTFTSVNISAFADDTEQSICPYSEDGQHKLFWAICSPTEKNHTLNCKLCDYEKTENCSFTVLLSSTRSICLEGGTATYKCSTCRNTEDVELPATNHEYTVETVEPTCEEDGYTRYTCINAGCSYYYDTEIVSATGHNYEFVETIAATTKSVGYDKYICSNCKEVYKDNYVDKLPKHEHLYKEVVATKANATTKQNGSIQNVCDCGRVKSTKKIYYPKTATLSKLHMFIMAKQKNQL